MSKAPAETYPRRKINIGDRKSTRLNSSHLVISYAVFCLKKKKNKLDHPHLESPARNAAWRPASLLAQYRVCVAPAPLVVPAVRIGLDYLVVAGAQQSVGR